MLDRVFAMVGIICLSGCVPAAYRAGELPHLPRWVRGLPAQQALEPPLSPLGPPPSQMECHGRWAELGARWWEGETPCAGGEAPSVREQAIAEPGWVSHALCQAPVDSGTDRRGDNFSDYRESWVRNLRASSGRAWSEQVDICHSGALRQDTRVMRRDESGAGFETYRATWMSSEIWVDARWYRNGVMLGYNATDGWRNASIHSPRVALPPQPYDSAGETPDLSPHAPARSAARVWRYHGGWRPKHAPIREYGLYWYETGQLGRRDVYRHHVLQRRTAWDFNGSGAFVRYVDVRYRHQVDDARATATVVSLSEGGRVLTRLRGSVICDASGRWGHSVPQCPWPEELGPIPGVDYQGSPHPLPPREDHGLVNP